jgi:thermitase
MNRTISKILPACVGLFWAAFPIDSEAKHAIRKHADGSQYVEDTIHFALKADFAGNLSPSDERHRVVDRTKLRSLHHAIAEIDGGHICADNWLQAKPLPKHIKQRPNEVPSIARFLTAQLKPGVDAAEVIEEFRRHPAVEWAVLSRPAFLSEIPNDSQYANQWAPRRINAEAAWDVPPATADIDIAIVDTGVDLQHPDLAGIISYQRGFAGNTSGDAPRDGRNRASHGTHVAGIAAAIRNNATGIAGIARARIMAMGCAVWEPISGQYIVLFGAPAMLDAIGNGAEIINCSWGPPDVAVAIAMSEARNHGVLVVVAAGNEASDITGREWDLMNPRPLIVSATDQNDNLSDFGNGAGSNFGWAIDLAAPGSLILSTIVGGYGIQSGTSMAAPCVAGAAALVRSMNPGLLEDDGTAHLLYRMATDIGPPGDDPSFGWGRVNLSRPFLQTMRNASACVGASPGNPTPNGRYDAPYTSLPQAIQSAGAGATLVLNGGLSYQASYSYPAISITTPVTLTALPDKPVTIGR